MAECGISESTSGSEMEETNYEPSSEVGRFQPPCPPEGFVMWQHGKSRILHLMDKENSCVFVCGRSAGPLHKKEGLQPRYDGMTHQFAGHVSIKHRLDSNSVQKTGLNHAWEGGRWQCRFASELDCKLVRGLWQSEFAFMRVQMHRMNRRIKLVTCSLMHEV